MARVSKMASADAILSWYAEKMGTDKFSILRRDAARAFFTCVLDETFGSTEAKMDDHDYLEAKVRANREDVELSINCNVQVSTSNDWRYFSYSFYGSDSAISAVLKKVEPKIGDPSLVRGERVFGQAASEQRDSKAESSEDSLTNADKALLLPAKWFALAFWAIFGFLLWIPILVRSHMFVSMAIALSALSGTRKDNLYRMIRYANSFWVRGFKNISDFANQESARDSTNIGSAVILLVIEASFAILFYGLILSGLQQL